MQLQQTHAQFQTTQWPLLEGLRDSDAVLRERAMSLLVRRYWPPVYATLRRAGHTCEDAAEFTQGFFADVVIGRGIFQSADANRGRLRTFMLSALKRYLVDKQRRRASRGAGRLVPLEGALEHEEQILQGAGDLAPDEAFDRRWSLALLEEALARCEQHFCAAGRAGHWHIFEARVLRPAMAPAAPAPLADLARQHGFRSAADAGAAVQVVKKRLLAILREVIGEMTSDPVEQEAEFEEVLALRG